MSEQNSFVGFGTVEARVISFMANYYTELFNYNKIKNIIKIWICL